MKTPIKNIFDIPEPCRKDDFIREYRKAAGVRKISMAGIILIQAGYIRHSVWLAAASVFLICVFGVNVGKGNITPVLSAMMPFVSGIAVLEYIRSDTFGMAETERAARFSLNAVLFARMAAIGISHIVLIFSASVFLGIARGYNVLITGVMLAVPYLFSSVLSLKAERTALGRENPYVCMAVSAFTSVLSIAAYTNERIFDEKYCGIWLFCAIILAVMELDEIKKLFETEEYVWN